MFGGILGSIGSSSQRESAAFQRGYDCGIQVGASNPILHNDHYKTAVGRCGFCGGVLAEDRTYQQIALREIKCSNCGAVPMTQKMQDRRIGDRRASVASQPSPLSGLGAAAAAGLAEAMLKRRK